METLDQGQVFGLVTLTHQEKVIREGRPKGSWWVGLCICGATVGPYTKAHWVKKIRSCAKCKYGLRPTRRIEGNANAASSTYRNYRSSAKTRGFSFDLTRDQFIDVATQPCCYCGRTKTSYFNATQDWEEKFEYTGLDRIDSLLGYSVDNVQPCCKVCNMAKSNMKSEDFGNWIQRLIDNYRP